MQRVLIGAHSTSQAGRVAPWSVNSRPSRCSWLPGIQVYVWRPVTERIGSALTGDRAMLVAEGSAVAWAPCRMDTFKSPPEQR